MLNALNFEKALRKYARAGVIEQSKELLTKLGKLGAALTVSEAAQLLYLCCGVSDKERARSAVAMQREDTTAGRAVRALEKLLEKPDMINESGVPTSVIRDVGREYRNKKTPGYINGKPIQVRGGSSTRWKPHAESYEVR